MIISDDMNNTSNTMPRILLRLLLLPLSLLLLGSCESSLRDAPAAPESAETTFTLGVRTQPETRAVAMGEDQRTVVLTWPRDWVKVLHLYFRQEGKVYDGGLLSPDWMHESLSYAEFQVKLHRQVDPTKPFDLIGVVARRVELDGQRILVGIEARPLYAVSAASDIEITDVPTFFEVSGIRLETGVIPTPELRHLGSMAVVWVKNASALPLDLAGVAVLPERGEASFYHKGALPYVGNEEIPYLDLLAPSAAPVMKHSRVVYPRTTIAAGEMVPMGFWLRPLDGQTEVPPSRVALYTATGSRKILSEGLLPKRTQPLELGQAYHIYTTWDGKTLQITQRPS